MNKKDQRVKVKIAETLANVRGIVRHIKNVQDNRIFLGEKLIELGEIDLGKNLIANGLKHDSSKFYGIEYEILAPFYATQAESDANTKKLKMKLAVSQHNTVNLHHPEAWASIQHMPEVYIAEFCCDVKAWAQEFGMDLREWLDKYATKRWKFAKHDKVYAKIMKFVNLLCETPFVAIH
jgi:hypothetical protein